MTHQEAINFIGAEKVYNLHKEGHKSIIKEWSKAKSGNNIQLAVALMILSRKYNHIVMPDGTTKTSLNWLVLFIFDWV